MNKLKYPKPFIKISKYGKPTMFVKDSYTGKFISYKEYNTIVGWI